MTSNSKRSLLLDVRSMEGLGSLTAETNRLLHSRLERTDRVPPGQGCATEGGPLRHSKLSMPQEQRRVPALERWMTHSLRQIAPRPLTAEVAPLDGLR